MDYDPNRVWSSTSLTPVAVRTLPTKHLGQLSSQHHRTVNTGIEVLPTEPTCRELKSSIQLIPPKQRQLILETEQMTDSPPKPPPQPGWYPDPGGQGQRYWDGRTWTHFESHEPQHHRPKWLVPVLIVAAVLAIIFSSIGGNDTEGDSASTSATTSTSVRATPADEPTLRPTPIVAPPGSAVRDGKFEFQVLAVTSANTVGDGYLTATAQGVFVIFTLSVRNIGDEPRSYYGQNQN
jgi:hypothetical protein